MWMSFEPLETDEKLDQPIKAKKDMDSAMLAGCFGFVLTSMTIYFLGIWPFLVFGDTFLLNVLILNLVLAIVPSLLFGIIATRKFGLPGACGYVGGSMSIVVFIYLRLKMILSMVGSQTLPQAEYPDSWVWLIPLIWLALSLIIAVISYPGTKED